MRGQKKMQQWRSGRLLQSFSGKLSESFRKFSTASAEDKLVDGDRKPSGTKRLLPRLPSFVSKGSGSMAVPKTPSLLQEDDKEIPQRRTDVPLTRRSTRKVLKTELTDLDRSYQMMRLSNPSFTLKELQDFCSLGSGFLVDFTRIRLRTRNLIGIMQSSGAFMGTDSTDQLDRAIRARKNTSQLVELGRVKTKNLRELITCFLPRMDLERILLADESTLDGSISAFEGTVLFCDISGFTRLTETLKNDPNINSGAEKLTQILNSFFTKLLDVVVKYQGDVVKFAGDAFLVVFHAPNDITLSLLAACQCAVEIQEKFTSYETEVGISFSVHMGIGAGTIFKMILGGVYNRWEIVFAGVPIAQISSATDDAKPGQTVLSRESWELVKDHTDATELESGNFLLNSLHIGNRAESLSVFIQQRSQFAEISLQKTVNRIKPYVPSAVLSKLLAGRSREEINELRQVTILFFNTPEVDVRSKEDFETLQNIAVRAQRSLYHYEGSVNKFLVDDKGTTLIGALGLPPLTHEDDSVRGLQCGLMMMELVRELGLDCSIGITTGKIFCGILGSETRSEYAVMGDTVNLAARLMQKGSPCDILCDKATYSFSKRWLRDRKIYCKELEPTKVKGKEEKIFVYRPTRRDFDSDSVDDEEEDGVMFGRDNEKQLFIGLLEKLKTNSSKEVHCVIMQGDAGVGKTQLVKYLSREATNLGVNALLGTANHVEQSVGYRPYRGVLWKLFFCFFQSNRKGKQESFDLKETVLRVLHQLDPKMAELGALLSSVLPIQLDQTQRVMLLSAEDRATLLHELLLKLIKFVTKASPTFIILEDCQWMDSKSWKLTHDILHHEIPLLILLTCRPLVQESRKPQNLSGPRKRMSTLSTAKLVAPVEFEKISSRADCKSIFLEDLDLDSLALIVKNHLGIKVDELPTLVLDVVAKKAKGNPFLCIELVESMREKGLIEIVDGLCSTTDAALTADQVDLPDNALGLVSGRLDRLPADHQLVLRISAAVGMSFKAGTVAEVLGSLGKSTGTDTNINIVRVFRHLCKARIIDQVQRKSSASQVYKYRFSMEILKDVAYGMMSFDFRKKVHLAIALHLENERTGNFKHVYSALAYHFLKAEDTASAIKYLCLAGKEAESLHVVDDTIRIYSDLLKLHKMCSSDAKSSSGLPTAHFRLSDVAEWQSKLGSAYIDFGDITKGKTHLVAAIRTMGNVFPETAEEIKEEFLKEMVRHRVIFKNATFLDTLEQTQTGAADLQEIEKANSQETQKLNELLTESKTYKSLSRIAYLRGDEQLQNFAIIKSLNSAMLVKMVTPQLSMCLAAASLVAVSLKCYEKGQSFIRQSLAIAEDFQSQSALLDASILSSIFYIQTGKLEEVQPLLKKAEAIAKEVENLRRVEEALNLEGCYNFIQGRFDIAASCFEKGVQIAKSRGERSQAQRLEIAHIASTVCASDETDGLEEQLIRFEAGRNSKIVVAMINALKALAEIKNGGTFNDVSSRLETTVELVDDCSAQVNVYMPLFILVVSLTYLKVADEEFINACYDTCHSLASDYPVARVLCYCCASQRERLLGKVGAQRSNLRMAQKMNDTEFRSAIHIHHRFSVAQ